jgi:two-component system, chemotaxis family, chemotaxis protein CheY
MANNFLLVDDSSIVRKVMLKTLRLSGVEIGEVFEAENGREALDVLAKQKVNLIFLDVNMPVMNGVEFLAELRSNPEWRDMPVVVVSTEGSRIRRAEIAEHEVRAYLRKPVTPEALASTVLGILHHGKSV